MAYYNLAAEYASLIVICLATIAFALDKNKGTSRYAALQWMQLATFISILVTIGSLITADFFMDYPIWLVDVLKYLYFLTAPVAAPIALFYGITLTYHKTHKISIFKNHLWAWVPYAVYCVFILTNAWHRLVFTISPTEGYIRGDLFRITYVIALLYAIMVVGFAIKHYKTPQRNNLLIICLNLFVSSIIFCTQLLYPPLQLSGIASVTGVLIIQFYVQNVFQSTDGLTELYHRTTLTIQMTKLCRQQKPYALFVFSIRNFKGINERNGLKFGDALLEKMALRLRAQLPYPQLFRYSGDEFAVLIPDFDASSQQLIDTIYHDLREPFRVDDTSIALDIVYARVDFPQFGTKTEDLISAMDYSISTIKKGIGNTSYFYDNTVCEQMRRRNHIIERMKQALATDGFEAYYQPIYSVKESKYTMAEALIRFKPSQGEFISPGEFIPIAEDIGLILRITETMLHLVCADYARLIAQFGPTLPVQSISVNFPYVWFMKQGAADQVYAIVQQYNLSPERIKIELTERTFATERESARVIMDEFIARGFVLELDDFGVEYSNFSTFFSLPIHMIKFDRSLVVASTANEKRRDFFYKLLLAVSAMDKEIEVVMEGVEDQDTLDFLIKCDCDYIQGFVFSKPLPYSDFVAFLS